MISDQDKAEILKYEEAIAEINKVRSPKTEKHWWESPGMISAITAIATVGLTSIFAYVTQSRLRDKDFETQQSKAAYDGEVSSLQRAHLLASDAVHWSGERDRVIAGDYRQLSDADKNPIIDSVNAADFRWRKGRSVEKIDLELSFGSGPEVVARWDGVVARVNDYANCTASRSHAPGECSPFRNPAAAAIDSFRTVGVDAIRRRWFGKAMF